MAKNIKLNTTGLKKIRNIDEKLTSYNVEMTEVTGCTFWKEYTLEQIAGNGFYDAGLSPVELSKEATCYVLAGSDGMRSTTMTLNGRKLVLGKNDELPDLSGVKAFGKLELAPGSCAFIEIL